MPAAAPPAHPVTFSGPRPVFRRLITRGALLELVTLGFYRFWLATDIRRHLWSHTAVDGDAAEYTGRAKELLIGFLVALAILLPIYLAYFLLGIEAERLQSFASVPLFLFLYLFSQFAMYRARRYRLTRTVWRGLRFSMRGSGWSYAWRAGLWTLAAVLTLGLLLPWRQAALERYKLRHTAYGSLQGRFVGTGGGLLRRGWWLWLLVPTGVLLVPLPFIYAGYKAIEWRWWVCGIRFGDHRDAQGRQGEMRLESSLTKGALIGIVWKVVGWFFLFGSAFVALMAVVNHIQFSKIGPPDMSAVYPAQERARGMAEMADPVNLLTIFGPIILGYLMMMVAMGIVLRLYLNRDIWARVAGTTTVHNLSAADDVVGQGEAVDALGEGLADGLDIGGL